MPSGNEYSDYGARGFSLEHNGCDLYFTEASKASSTTDMHKASASNCSTIAVQEGSCLSSSTSQLVLSHEGGGVQVLQKCREETIL